MSHNVKSTAWYNLALFLHLFTFPVLILVSLNKLLPLLGVLHASNMLLAMLFISVHSQKQFANTVLWRWASIVTLWTYSALSSFHNPLNQIQFLIQPGMFTKCHSLVFIVRSKVSIYPANKIPTITILLLVWHFFKNGVLEEGYKDSIILYIILIAIIKL